MPDDFLEHGEHPEAAARRILAVQLGIEASRAMRLATVESFANGTWHLIFHHRLDLDQQPPISPVPNVAEAAWFDLDALPQRNEIAHEGWALDVIEQLRSARN